jgi:hypothetical protein
MAMIPLRVRHTTAHEQTILLVPGLKVLAELHEAVFRTYALEKPADANHFMYNLSIQG